MGKIFTGIIFFVGWILSPFTWWNDSFVNIPLSYLIANFAFYFIKIPFKWLVLSSYWLTNLLGLLFMYLGGKRYLSSPKAKMKSTILLVVVVMVYSFIMIQLDKYGKLHPLSEYFHK